VFKTLYPLPKGTELNISYIAGSYSTLLLRSDILIECNLTANQSTKRRRKELKKVYHFDCICPRCVQEEGAGSYPCTYYDKFYDKHIACPLECTGILRAETVHAGINGKPPTEDRECITCSEEFPGREVVPPIAEFLEACRQKSEKTTANPKRRNKHHDI